MTTPRILGTPNTPVELRTLSVGDWYINDDEDQIVDDICPSKITRPRVSGDGYCSLRNYGTEGWDYYNLLVHPLTKIGDDWWYKGSEPRITTEKGVSTFASEPKADDKSFLTPIQWDNIRRVFDEILRTALESAKAEPAADIRPIGELPVGTLVDYLEGSEPTSHGMPRFIGPRREIDGKVTIVDSDNNLRHLDNDGFLVRVIRYPDPSPTPSYLDRLPEALRVAIHKCLGRNVWPDPSAESLARAIWESRDDLFVAGSPRCGM